jgi:hypothetical protein
VARVGVGGFVDFEVGANRAASIGSAGFRVSLVDVQAERPTARAAGATAAPGGTVTSASPDFHRFLRGVSADFEYLIAAYPVGPTSPGLELALSGDYLILTLVDGVTTRFEVREAIARSKELGIDVLGFVFTPRLSRRRRARARMADRTASDGSAR